MTEQCLFEVTLFEHISCFEAEELEYVGIENRVLGGCGFGSPVDLINHTAFFSGECGSFEQQGADLAQAL